MQNIGHIFSGHGIQKRQKTRLLITKGGMIKHS